MANDTRQKLIDTAIDLIWQSSFGAVSVDDICKAADVKKGSFYHFFPSKAHLSVAAIDAHFAANRPGFDDAFSPSRPPLARFEALADYVLNKQTAALEKYGRVCGCPFASLGCEMAGQDELIRARTDEIFDVHQRYSENALRDAQRLGLIPADRDVSLISNEICTYVIGQMTIARIQNSLDMMNASLKDGILRIIGADSLAKRDVA